MTSKQKGPLRLLADEVERTLIPGLVSSGLTLDPAASNQGKWNRTGYQWFLKFEDPTLSHLRCRLMIARKKSTILAADLISHIEPTNAASWLRYEKADWLASHQTAPADFEYELVWQRRLMEYRLSRIGQSLWLADNLPRSSLLRWEDSLPVRILVYFGTLPWLFAALFGLLLSIPFLGYSQRGESAPAVQSGNRQREMARRIAGDFHAIFKAGVPGWLYTRV